MSESSTVAGQDCDSADPLIDEVREIRRRLSEAAGNDPMRLAEMANRAAEEYLRAHPTSKRLDTPPAPHRDASASREIA
jgi:hypothetical protein